MRSFFSTSSTPTPTPSPSPSPSPSPPLPHAPYNNTSNKRLARTKLGFCDTSCLASSTVTQLTTATPKYALECASDDEDEDEDDIAVTVTVKPVGSPSSSLSSFSSTSTSSDSHAAMSIRTKAIRQAKDPKDPKNPKDSLSASNPPNGTAAGHDRPATTPSSPVQIPKRSHRDKARHMKKENVHRNQRRQPKHVGSLDAISPSVAALLAMTDIPRPHRRRRLAERNLSVDEVMSDQHDSGKDVGSSSLCRGPLDLLLSPPEDLADDDLSATESNIGSLLARTISADSVPSLGGESFATDFGSSIDTPGERRVSTSARRRHSPMRKSLEPVRSPPDATEEHPLAGVDGMDLEELLELPSPEEESTSCSYPLPQPFKPLRFAFKSNLTASLRALRSAAKSFSSINFPTIPTDDLLTRSILTIDPNVPYMDERRPPVTEEMPSAELRRYLNPTTSSHLDPRPKARTNGTFSASIQMQTYKVQRSPSAPPCSPRTTPPYVPGNAPPSASPSNNGGGGGNQHQHHQHPQQHPAKAGHQAAHVPGMRQREMRENPDFIRIAVMEMAMRRRGKLDDQKTGRARWALPPRRPSAKPYEVGSNGVPSRWIPVTCGPY